MNRTLKFSVYIVLIITFIIQIAICDQNTNTKIIQNNNINEIEEESLIDNFKIAKDTETKENEENEIDATNNAAISPISRNKENNNEIYINNNKKSTTQMIDTSIINNNKACKIIESCRRCQENEIQSSFCKDTNSFRVKLSCKNRGELYRSCNINNHNNNNANNAGVTSNINDGYLNDTNINQMEKKSAINILYFEIGVLVVFVFSIYFVKERKRLSQIQNNEKLQKIIDKQNSV